MQDIRASFRAASPGATVILGLLFVSAAVGCTDAPPGSPTPSPSGSPPTATPSPTFQPSPTATPTPTPTPSPTFGADEINHPTGPTEIILQMESGGGFVPIEFLVTQAPSFSLYGDGTLIFRPTEDSGPLLPNGGLPRFMQAHLTEDQVQALLRFALGQGRLLEARDVYVGTCADCPATIFTLNAADISKTVTVNGLSEIEPPGPDALDRRAFSQVQQTLAGFDQRARNGELGEVTLYEPTVYRVVLIEAGGGVAGEPGAWPWPDLTIDDFPKEGDGFRRVAMLDEEHVPVLTDVPSGGIGSIPVEGPDDTLWTVGIRPLLPNEMPADPLAQYRSMDDGLPS